MHRSVLVLLLLSFPGLPAYLQAKQIPDASVSSAAPVKIPIDTSRWYQLNNTSNGLGQLFDGVLNVRPFTGWGKVLSNYDSYYPVLPGETITISSIKLFDWEGIMKDYPLTIYIITDAWKRIKVATFTGEQYNTWVGPYPERPNVFTLDTAMKNIKYIVLNSWYEYPAEIEFYGTYKAPSKTTAVVKTPVKLKNFFGVNTFEWDFEDPNNPLVIDETRMKPIKSFSGIRHYMDWEKLELQQGSYTYNPVYSGGWNYDTMYARCKAEGIEVLACLKTIPGWMQATYPEDERDGENTPVKYNRDFSDPNSYIEEAKVAFQYIARYGSNKNVSTSLLSVNGVPRWTNDPVNKVRVGLGFIRYIECDNERDKWWKGRKAYQTGREYAANLSAFYDGNKNTMGQGVGVKNADPNVLVVMAGTASVTTDYVRGMIDWCKEFRGYKPDGSVNVCWDIINYHLYANDAGSSQNGSPSRGIAPELSLAATVANNFIQMAHLYVKDMPVWVTETGYDINQGSTQKAIPVGNKTALQTQADWILRTALLYARSGIQKAFFYELYDDYAGSSGIFATSGLINADKSRRPAADFLFQANKLFGEYTYKETLKKDPFVDRYELNGNSMYALVVPDETNRIVAYSLNLGVGITSANIYTPKAGSDNMDVKTVAVTNGKLKITVTETPVFIMPVLTSVSYAFR